MIAVRVGKDGRGDRLALCKSDDGSYGVWVERQNYSANAPGGIAKSWRYIEKGLPLAGAEALFKRRNKRGKRP